MLSNIVNIKWQSLKAFHRGEIRNIKKKVIKNDKITALIQKMKLDKGAFLYG